MRNEWMVALTVVALLVSGSVAWGDVALKDSPTAMPGWAGDEEGLFNTTDPMYPGDPRSVHVRAEYAVFEPGDAPLDSDPSGGLEYVYAYQLFVFADSDYPVSAFSVYLDSSADGSNIGNDTTCGTLGGLVPEFQAISAPTTSAKWLYGVFGPPIDPSTYTDVLYFTSPYGPIWAHGSVIEGGTAANIDDLPTPMPEPVTLSLLAVGAVALLRRRR